MKVVAILMSLCFFVSGQSDLETYVKKIDLAVLQKIKANKLKPNPLINDETFLRRIYLDIAGRIPTGREIETFRKSSTTDKRSKLIDQLIDSEAYVSHTFNFWADTLRAKTKLNKVNGATYLEYIKDTVRTNKAYDKFVYELLTAEGYAYEFGNGATGYLLRDNEMPLDNLANTMQIFLGVDMVCAQCHDHPYDRWTQLGFYKLAAFNSGVTTNNDRFVKTKEKKGDGKDFRKDLKNDPELRKHSKAIFDIMSGKVAHNGTGLIRLPHDYSNSEDDLKPFTLVKAQVPFGDKVMLTYSQEDLQEKVDFTREFKGKKQAPAPGTDIGSREVFAKWLTSKDNPMFTKAIVNRLWNRVMGVPLIGPLSGFSQNASGVSLRLTKALVDLMQKLNYDQKAFLKILYRTNTYQRASTSKELQPAERYYFQGPVLKRLSAEQIWDSLIVLAQENPDSSLKGKPMMNSRNVLYDKVVNLSKDELKAFLKENAGEKKLRKGFSDEVAAMNNQGNSRKEGKRRKGGKGKRGQSEQISSSGEFRASELQSPASGDHFLRRFGQSERNQIDDASKEASITQALSLMNGVVEKSLIQNKSSVIQQALADCKSDLERIKKAYWLILCRLPSIEEYSMFRSLPSIEE